MGAEDDEDDESSDDDDDDVPRGRAAADGLQATGLDIPRVDDIPVVSKLASKTDKERMEEMDGNERMEYKLQANRENVNKMIQHDDDELETHFVENPFIKLREKAQ